MILADLLTIGKVYLISFVIQLVCWPITATIFGKLTDKGWPVSRLITSLVVSLIVWEVGNLGLPINTNAGYLTVLVGVGVFNVWWLRRRSLDLKITSEGLKMIVMEEYLFLVGLLGISLIRGFLPNIDSLEKFMDFGFINRYLSSSTLPTMDMWQAEKSINYYSFGQFWASGLIRFFMVEAAVGYNLVLAFVAGLSMSIAFGISHLLAGAKKASAGMVAGLIGAMTTVLAGNSHVIWYFINHSGLDGYWYADATRFIHNTIHEFPGYSFVVADLHGHVLGLPIVLLFMLVFITWLRQRAIVFEIFMGILFGIMMMTNTWDVAVYGLLMVMAGIQLVIHDPKNIFRLLRSAGVVAIFAGLTALPWYISFESISSGVRLVTERSPLWQLGVLWAGGFFITAMSILITGRGFDKLPIRTIGMTIVLLIVIPELVYAKDIYPDHPRANTMFKLTYQASVMIGLLSGALWGKLLDPDKKIWMPVRWVTLAIVAFIFAGTMIFPTVSFPNFYNNFKKYQGLNGETWMQTDVPEKYGVIKFLQKNKDERNMVEAVGDSYTKFNAVSVFSGVPSVEGWRVHEWLWRGGFDSVAVRETNVKNIYETTDQEQRVLLLKKYNVGWILVGADEKGMYETRDKQIQDLGEVVYEQNGTYLVKLK
jgi:uncharacterized membrane protein